MDIYEELLKIHKSMEALDARITVCEPQPACLTSEFTPEVAEQAGVFISFTKIAEALAATGINPDHSRYDATFIAVMNKLYNVAQEVKEEVRRLELTMSWVPKEGEMIGVSHDNENWYQREFVRIAATSSGTFCVVCKVGGKDKSRVKNWDYCKRVTTAWVPKEGGMIEVSQDGKAWYQKEFVSYLTPPGTLHCILGVLCRSEPNSIDVWSWKHYRGITK